MPKFEDLPPHLKKYLTSPKYQQSKKERLEEMKELDKIAEQECAEARKEAEQASTSKQNGFKK